MYAQCDSGSGACLLPCTGGEATGVFRSVQTSTAGNALDDSCASVAIFPVAITMIWSRTRCARVNDFDGIDGFSCVVQVLVATVAATMPVSGGLTGLLPMGVFVPLVIIQYKCGPREHPRVGRRRAQTVRDLKEVSSVES